MNIYLEYKDEKSAKFWKIAVNNETHTVTYGKTGTDGQSKTKTFESAEKALKEAEKLVKAKTKKGYQEVGGAQENSSSENEISPKVDATPTKVIFMNPEEAMERFNLEQYDPLGSLDYDTVIVFEGDTLIDRDIDDDSIEAIFFNNERETEAELIIINGNLTVNGTLDLSEEYPGLLVLGDLHCEVLCSNDNCTNVTGDAFIKYVYDGNYNHGSITIDGTTHVPYLLNSDHCSDLNPSPKTILINYYNNHDDSFNYDYYSDDIPNIFPKGLLDEDDLDIGAFIERVKSGKSPFKSGVKPSRVVIENEIKKLAQESDSGEGLRELDLSEKKLLKLPLALFELNNLEVLNLSKNKFSVIPDALGKLGHLKKLNLTDTNVKKLPEAIGQLKNLEILNLEDCHNLESLPESIGLLENLKVLNLENCRQLESLPESIGQLKNLEVLNLKDCTTIESLPEAIGHLTNLKELTLQCCQGKVPPSISKLTTLEELNITNRYGYGTEPIDFPDWICDLKGLKRLHAGSCKFKNLPESLSNLSKLEYLNLNRSLVYLEEVADLSQLENLKELRLSGGATDSPHAPQETLQPFFKIKSLETLTILEFGTEVKQSIKRAEVEKKRAALKNDPKSLAKFESSITTIDGYSGRKKRLSMIKYADDPEKLEEDKKRLMIDNVRYEYKARRGMISEDFKGLEQLVNLKVLDIRGIILGFLPEEFTKLKQLQTIRCYRNIFSEEDAARLEALGIAVTR